jgi:hypothetical protein
MKRALLSLGALLCVVALAAPVRAVAPVDQYDKFNSQTATIADLKTGLEWDRYDRDTYPSLVGFDTARQACENAGKRLPTLKELLTIVDESPYYRYVEDHNETRYIDPNAFPFSPSEAFWTSSLFGGSKVYTVDFVEGMVDSAGKSDPRRYRCVKSL